VIIEFGWTVSASDMHDARCCVCNRGFRRGPVTADVISDADRLHIGEVCPSCLEAGAAEMERRLVRRLEWQTMMQEHDIYMTRRAIQEDLRAPSYAEFLAFEQAVGGPRYATDEEAQAAWERGEW